MLAATKQKDSNHELERPKNVAADIRSPLHEKGLDKFYLANWSIVAARHVFGQATRPVLS